MKLEIRTYGDPILRAPTARVETVDDDIRRLVADMIDTMHEAHGIGLAAPQIGRSLSLCVIDLPADYDMTEDGRRLNPDARMPLVLINPQITSVSKRKDEHEEGCLSFPGVRGMIERPSEITLRFMDEQGATHEKKYVEFLARVIQHEVDHLNGVLFIDRMSVAKKFALKGKLKRLEAETKERLGLA
jgi:peptide deformylase